MSRKLRLLTILSLLATLTIAVVGAAAAADETDAAGSDGAQPFVVTGIVVGKDVAAGTFRLRTEGWRFIQVHTSPDTSFVIHGVSDPTLADLRLGDRAWVGGLRHAESQLAAQFVVQPPEVARGLRGEIQAKVGSTLLVSAPNGPVSLLTNADTHFFIPGEPGAGLGDFARGDHILAVGYPTPVNDTLIAYAVIRLGP